MRAKSYFKLRQYIVPTATAAVFLVAWEGVIRAFSITPLILPSPARVTGALAVQYDYLLYHGAITLLESVLGLLMGGAAAVLLAVAFQFSPNLRRALYPYAIGIKSIPLVALAPILVVWFDTGLLSKVVMAAIISFFPVLVNTVQGLNSVEPEALDLMTIFAASKWQVLTKLQFPQALPYLFTGLKVSATFAVVGAVVAEFVGSSAGIGYIVKSSSYYLNTELTFAAIVVAAMIGFLFFLMVGLLESMVVFWRPKGEQEFSGLTGDAAPDKV